MGFSRQEYWSGLPRPPPGYLPDPRTEPRSPTLQADSLPLSHQGSPHYWSNGGLVTKMCVTLCNPIHCSLQGSFPHGISQARILEWVAVPFSRGSSQPRDQTHIPCIGRPVLHHFEGPLGSPQSPIQLFILLVHCLFSLLEDKLYRDRELTVFIDGWNRNTRNACWMTE